MPVNPAPPVNPDNVLAPLANGLLPGNGAPLQVSVRTLCHFTARSGDLDLRFTPSPTGVEGIAGHQTVTSRRSAG